MGKRKQVVLEPRKNSARKKRRESNSLVVSIPRHLLLPEKLVVSIPLSAYTAATTSEPSVLYSRLSQLPMPKGWNCKHSSAWKDHELVAYKTESSYVSLGLAALFIFTLKTQFLLLWTCGTAAIALQIITLNSGSLWRCEGWLKPLWVKKEAVVTLYSCEDGESNVVWEWRWSKASEPELEIYAVAMYHVVAPLVQIVCTRFLAKARRDLAN